MIANKCFKVANGIVVVLNIETEELANITEEDLAIEFAEYGLNVIIGSNVVPIPEIMFDYITENRNITIYAVNDAEYFFEPTLHLELPKESLIEAKGAYRFWSMQKDAVAEQEA